VASTTTASRASDLTAACTRRLVHGRGLRGARRDAEQREDGGEPVHDGSRGSVLYICIGGEANAKNGLPTVSSVGDHKTGEQCHTKPILRYGAWVEDSLSMLSDSQVEW
jgi:hypothetical protein